MRYPFDSDSAKKLNIKIFETIYYGALEASSELAEKLGPYETYEGLFNVSNSCNLNFKIMAVYYHLKCDMVVIITDNSIT